MIERYIILRCDTCQNDFEQSDGTAAELRKWAQKAGWRYQLGTATLPSQQTNKGDFCPECLERAKGITS